MRLSFKICMTLSLIFMVKVDGAIRLHVTCKYMHICSILQDIATQNMHDLEFVLSLSLKVEVYGANRKPMHDFLLVNSNNYMPICSIFRDTCIATQNMHDLEIDILRSLKVKVDAAIRKPM